jgi:hypothetical protein
MGRPEIHTSCTSRELHFQCGKASQPRHPPVVDAKGRARHVVGCLGHGSRAVRPRDSSHHSTTQPPPSVDGQDRRTRENGPPFPLPGSARLRVGGRAWRGRASGRGAGSGGGARKVGNSTLVIPCGCILNRAGPCAAMLNPSFRAGRAAGRIGGTIGLRQEVCKMTVQHVVEVVIIVIVVYVAVRLYRKRG